MPPVGSAGRDCILLLRQGRSLFARLADAIYSAPGALGGAAGAGAHLRHVLDYVDCLLAGADAGSIDYTIRRRCREVERSATAGVRELDRCIESLGKLEPERERASVDVRCDEGEPWVVSTLARELRFVASHAVHHFALIQLVLAHHGEATPADFGVSPSTLAHRSRGG